MIWDHDAAGSSPATQTFLGLDMKKYYVVFNSNYGGFHIGAMLSEFLKETHNMTDEEICDLRDHSKRCDKRLIGGVRFLQRLSPLYTKDLEIEEINTPAYTIEEYDGKETVYPVYCNVILDQ